MTLRRFHALVLAASIAAMTLLVAALTAAPAHADEPTPVPFQVCAATPGNACRPSPTPQLLPATTITVSVDAATIIPSTVRPAALADTGAADGRYVLIGLLVVACGAWLVCFGRGLRR